MGPFLPKKFTKSQLMAMSEARCAAEVAGFQRDETVPLHPDKTSEDDDHRYGGHAKQV